MDVETKNEKFERIAPKRVENFKLSAERLSKISNKVFFEYTDEQKAEILKEIEEVYKFLKSKFN